jgi:hypothetical protein
MKHMCKDTPDVVAVILTQLSKKARLKEWGTDAKKAVTSKALQKNLSGCALEQNHTRSQNTDLELQHFTKKDTDDTGGLAKAKHNKQQLHLQVMQAHQPWQQSKSSRPVPSQPKRAEMSKSSTSAQNAFIHTKIEAEKDQD